MKSVSTYLVCVSLAVSACASSAPIEGVKAAASPEPARRVAQAQTDGKPAGSALAESPEYVIGPGDTLKIVVLQNPQLNAEVPVRPDGKISTPLANDVLAVGKTPSELGKAIEKALAEYVRAPNVSVIVSNPVSTFSQVKVVGQAVSPRAVPFRNGMTVLDLVIEVGGLSQFAAGNRAKIIRPGKQGAAKEIKVRLGDLLNKGKVSENITLEPGDILVIPETLF
jgi:polysaccharide biosynthesis/export protein